MIRTSGYDADRAGTDGPQPALRHGRLLRNGGLLTLSSVATSLIGLAYWTAATHRYDPEVVGRNSAALSAMMFIAGVANLNLMSALVRFLPVAGSSARKLVQRVYLATSVTALVLGSAFLLLLPWLAPDLRFLTAGTPLAAWFVVSTVAWTIFVLQDSALTGLRHTWLVPVENAVYAGAKLAIVIPLVALAPRSGIFVSWTAALVVSIAPVNYFLFRRAIPHPRSSPALDVLPPHGSSLIRFAAADYGGALAWLAALNVVPLLVLQIAGPTSNGYFAVVWVIAYGLYLVSANMGISLVVETAAGWSELATACRTVVSSILKVLIPVVALLVATAPLVLGAFGSDYSRHGTTALRLLAISAIPNVVTATAISALRAQQRTGTGTAVLLVLTGLVFLLSALLLPGMGITAVGVAWLIAQTITAAAVLTVPSLWPGRASGSRALQLAGRVAGGIRRLPTPLLPALITGRRGERLLNRSDRRLDAAVGEAMRRLAASGTPLSSASGHEYVPVSTQSDLAVAKFGPVGMAPVAVLKMASSPPAKAALQMDMQVVAELRADCRLGSWQHLLPEVMESWSTSEASFVVERYIPGVDGRRLCWDDRDRSERALATAASAISDLHRRTASKAVLHAGWVTEWVSRPVSNIASLYPTVDWRASALHQIECEITDELLGRALMLGWCHGDYTPGNLILAADGSTLHGVVDWCGGSPNAPGFLDAIMLLVSTRMLRERRELGDVVTGLLSRHDLSPVEQGLIDIDDRVTARTKLIVCWLNHVSANLEKASFYRTHLLWKALNIDAVLRKLVRC